jgi:hypothetical protein
MLSLVASTRTFRGDRNVPLIVASPCFTTKVLPLTVVFDRHPSGRGQIQTLSTWPSILSAMARRKGEPLFPL